MRTARSYCLTDSTNLVERPLEPFLISHQRSVTEDNSPIELRNIPSTVNGFLSLPFFLLPDNCPFLRIRVRPRSSVALSIWLPPRDLALLCQVVKPILTGGTPVPRGVGLLPMRCSS